jgi:LEA14-like dessication related protein
MRYARSLEERNTVPVAALLVVLVVGAAVALAYYAIQPPTSRQEFAIGNLQVRSTSVVVATMHTSYVGLDIDAVVYNPNSFGATLATANYSVSADGRYLGSGRTTHSYVLSPKSSLSVELPINVGWRSAFDETGNYLVNLGHVSWRVNGTAVVEVAGFSVTVPFEFTIG